MTLAEYLEETRESYADFARRIGSTRQAVRRYAVEGRVPEPKAMQRIVFATGGKVTANDFFGMAA